MCLTISTAFLYLVIYYIHSLSTFEQCLSTCSFTIQTKLCLVLHLKKKIAFIHHICYSNNWDSSDRQVSVLFFFSGHQVRQYSLFVVTEFITKSPNLTRLKVMSINHTFDSIPKILKVVANIQNSKDGFHYAQQLPKYVYVNDVCNLAFAYTILVVETS